MSDDLMIQGMTQPQVQRKNPVPYALGAGALAGVGGYAIASGVGGKELTHDDLVAKANEADKVELTSKKEALTKAEAELETASKAVYEGTEKSAAEAAAKARDAELARLTESSSGSKVFKPKTFDKAEINLSNITENTRTGKKFKLKHGVADVAEVKAEYDILVRDYEAAVRKMETRVGRREAGELASKQAIIENYLNGVHSRNATRPIDKFDAIFSSEKPGWKEKLQWWDNAHEVEFNKANKTANKLYPKLNTTGQLTNEQIMSFAEKMEDGTPRQKYKVAVREADGIRTKTTWYTFSEDMFKEFQKAENERIIEQRNAIREALLGRAGEHVTSTNKQGQLTKTVTEMLFEKNPTRYGLDATVAADDIVAKLLQETGGVTVGEAANAGFYQKDLDIIKNSIEKNGTSHTTLPTGLKGKYTGAANLGELQEMVMNRKDVLKLYNEENRAIRNSLKSCKSEYEVIKNLEERIASMRDADDGVRKAKEALEAQFSGITEGTAKAGLTEAEAMERESYKKLAKIAEEKQAAYDKIAAEKGKVNETAKKTAEEFRNKAKGEYDKIAKEVGAKFKGMSKATKGWIAAGTAAAGALITAAVISNKNKAAEAAAQQNIYA